MNKYLKTFLIEFGKTHSPRTKANYKFYLNRFLNWSKIISPQQITLEKIKKYRQWLAGQKNNEGELLEKSTINYHLIALRSFLKFLKQKKLPVPAPKAVTLQRTPRPETTTLTQSELAQLLAAPLKTKEQEIIKRRDKAILETLFSTGLKVAQLSALQKKEINFKEKFTTYNRGGKKRRIIFSQQAKFWLKKYLDQRFDDSPYLFVSHDRAHQKKLNSLTPRSIQRLVKYYADRAGLDKKITPQTLRQTCATWLLNSDWDLKTVRNTLGLST